MSECPARCIVRSRSKDTPALIPLLVAFLPLCEQPKERLVARKSVEPELATMVKPEEVKKKRPPTAHKARSLDDL